jgi:serine/threonine protein kinase
MERVEGTDLFDFISEMGALGEHLSKKLFSEVVDSVAGCQEMGEKHGDIKDKNIMVENTETELQCTLIDFDSDTWQKEGQVYTHYNGTMLYAPHEYLGFLKNMF